ncbi:MAG TPA: VOC family protein [Ilumatobacteraceae bacterium]|nr:VOC family protein [Ilumatobacteraceae bacterium]
MTIRIATITVEAHSPRRLADFWSALLDYREVSHPTTSIRIDDPAGTGPTILFQPGRTKTHVMKNRIHFDLRPVSRDDAIERALRLGAARCDIGQPGDESWAVLADPEGNEFCILQSMHDLEQTTASQS